MIMKRFLLLCFALCPSVVSSYHLHHGALLQRPSLITSSPRQPTTRLDLSPKHAAVITSSSRKLILPKSIVQALRGGATAASAAAAGPPLSQWLGPALACALSYALYNIFIKKGSASIDPMLGGVILQTVAVGLGSIVLAIVKGANKTTFLCKSSGVKWACAAGMAVGLAELLSFYVSSTGVQASKSIPIIIGGSVLFGTILGAVWLKETLTIRGWLGVLMISMGIALVGLDPGSVSMH